MTMPHNSVRDRDTPISIVVPDLVVAVVTLFWTRICRIWRIGADL